MSISLVLLVLVLMPEWSLNSLRDDTMRVSRSSMEERSGSMDVVGSSRWSMEDVEDAWE